MMTVWRFVRFSLLFNLSVNSFQMHEGQANPHGGSSGAQFPSSGEIQQFNAEQCVGFFESQSGAIRNQYYLISNSSTNILINNIINYY